MAYYDVFNGDADGICSLIQLRNAKPLASTLITGVKRDIKLMENINAVAGDQITVLDVSMDKNKSALLNCLEAGAEVFYCDHHAAGDIPESEKLSALINTDANVCTALLINGHLNGQYAEWAITGAFGDNLNASAEALAKTTDLTASEVKSLANLGVYINYNGYGASLEDLHFTPENLYRELVNYASPLQFMQDNKAAFEKLECGYRDDMASAESLKPVYEYDHAAVFMLPNEKWARRVSGVYSNDLANASPDRAHAVVTEKADGGYLVSVRAPLNNKQGAVDICQQFNTGGGRAAAAGINALPASDLEKFVEVFQSFYR